MVKKKRGPGRPRKRGRPKGSRNKPLTITAISGSLKKGDKITFGPEMVFSGKVDIKSRLDECMTRLETAVAEAISKLKESI